MSFLADSWRFAHEVEAFDPDLILLDLHMPDPDGFAVLAALSARREEDYLPVVVLTGDATVQTRERALAAGASDFLTKPFDAQEVLIRVRNLLHTRGLYRALRDRNATLIDAVAERGEALARSQEARAAIVAALNALPNNRVVTELAHGVCSAILRQPSLDAVVLYGLSPNGATVLAAEGDIARDSISADGIPAGHARYLYERARDGAWNEPWQARPEAGEFGRRAARAGLKHALYVPLLAGTEPVGILAAGTASELRPAEAIELGAMLEEYGAVARALLVPELVSQRTQARVGLEIEEVIRTSAFKPVFQPVVDLDTGLAIGAEALTRFADGTRPDIRFEQASALGLGIRLELATLQAAIGASRALPAGSWVSLNVSPGLILARDGLAELLTRSSRPVVLEVTEHVPVGDYPALRAAIDRLRPVIRLAIDDAGAGFASFRHILELRPDYVKLDLGLVRGIDADPARQALVAGMRYFATKTTCRLIAEGIETPTELATLRTLAVQMGQGYLLGRPEPIGPARRPRSPHRSHQPGAGAVPASRRDLPGRRPHDEGQPSARR
jgi:EAL domain-containing protein (putative c-di-GMP-specific phosphodiesterase class I)/FixJ family two-component response regulator